MALIISPSAEAERTFSVPFTLIEKIIGSFVCVTV